MGPAVPMQCTVPFHNIVRLALKKLFLVGVLANTLEFDPLGSIHNLLQNPGFMDRDVSHTPTMLSTPLLGLNSVVTSL